MVKEQSTATSSNAVRSMDARTLEAFIRQVFEKVGFAPEKASEAAHVLIQADLGGIDSHGCARLDGYLRQIQEGKIDVEGRPEIVHETPSTATLDAHKSLGLISAREGMKQAIEKAKNAGSGWVAIKNSSHFGIAAAHTELALDNDMIGIALTNASPLVAPAGGTEAKLGTNPVCVAIPAGQEDPVIVDMATTVVANGKLEIANRNDKEVPEGWVQTSVGDASSNPSALQAGGTLLPLGSDRDHSYHKGYALGSVVDILSGVLSGANFGPWVPPFVSFLDQSPNQVGEGIGHFVGAFRIDAFRPKEAFQDSIDQWIRSMRDTEPLDNKEPVKIPGDPERAVMEERRKNGIPLNAKVYHKLQEIGETWGVEID